MIRIKDSITFSHHKTSLWQLYKLGSKGTDGVQAQIGVRRGMLQRKLQQDEWRANDKLRVKDYLYSLIQGSAETDSFMIVPIELVLSSLKQKLTDAVDNSMEETIEDTIKDVEQDKEEGVTLYILDGQNRLFEAIIPFFDNEVPLSPKRQIAVDDKTNKEVSLAGKFFKNIPNDIQNFLKDLEVNIHFAKEGDIDTFIASLIAKNSGINWIEWQIMMVNNIFTKFRKQISMITEDQLIIDNVLSKINKSEYTYRKDGYELFISELLIWMQTKTQPKTGSVNMQSQFFKGEDGNVVSEKMVKSLKTYLREFAKTNTTKKLTSHIIVRNYVMFRYALDNPKQFSTINLPNWKIEKPVEFVGRFIMAHEAAYDIEDAYNKIYDANGKFVKKDKVPGYLPFMNSSYDKDLLLDRIQYYSNEMVKIDALVKGNIVIELDTTPMPSVIKVAMDNDMKDYKGNAVFGAEVVGAKFNRGHAKPRCKGGSNTDLRLQSPKSNKSYGATAL